MEKMDEFFAARVEGYDEHMFKAAGFATAEKVFRMESTTIIIAKKD